MSSKEEKIGDFKLAISNLKDILDLKNNSQMELIDNFNDETDDTIDFIMRDAAIKRFELCYDLAWKCLKHKLAEVGVDIQNPRAAYSESVRSGFLKDDGVWFEIIAARNNAVHSYDTDLANELYKKIPEYVDEFEEVYEVVK